MQKLNDRRSPAIFFTSLTSVQKSSLPFRDNHPPRNLIEKFARLRPFTIIHSVLAIARPLKSSPEFARLHPSSIKFAFLFFVFSNFCVFVIGLPLKFPENEITRRIKKTRKNESTKKNAICYAVVFRPRTGLTGLTANKTGTGSWLPGACPAFVPSSIEPPRISPHQIMAAGAIRFQFIPRCQRSIFVVKFWFRKSRRAVDVIPRNLSRRISYGPAHRYVLPRLEERRGFGAKIETRSVIRLSVY